MQRHENDTMNVKIEIAQFLGIKLFKVNVYIEKKTFVRNMVQQVHRA